MRGVTEPEPASSWAEVEQHLTQYERILRDQPALRELVLSLATRLRQYSDQIPGVMPATVARRFARLGNGQPG